MRLKNLIAGLVAAVALSGGAALACDGWRLLENEGKKYEAIELTAEQKQKIDELKKAAIAGFSHDHGAGGCDHAHKQTVAKFTSAADGVLTNAQVAEMKTAARMEAMEKEIAALKKQIEEIKNLLRELKK